MERGFDYKEAQREDFGRGNIFYNMIVVVTKPYILSNSSNCTLKKW